MKKRCELKILRFDGKSRIDFCHSTNINCLLTSRMLHAIVDPKLNELQSPPSSSLQSGRKEDMRSDY